MPGQLLSMALDNEKLQAVLAELIDRIAEKLGIGLEKLTTIFGWRKQKEEEQPDH
jgi:hypothetical protein